MTMTARHRLWPRIIVSNVHALCGARSAPTPPEASWLDPLPCSGRRGHATCALGGMNIRDNDAFPHRKLDVCRVAREAMVLGDRMSRGLPRGHAPFADQLRRASQSAYLQSVEGAARWGAD